MVVRELFIMARQHAPSIMLMDEIDSICSTRTDFGKGNDSEVQRKMLELPFIKQMLCTQLMFISYFKILKYIYCLISKYL